VGYHHEPPCGAAHARKELAMTSDASNRWLRHRGVSGDDYDATYERRAAAGEDVHGEADFAQSFAPQSVLDAGCGTGRVGRELARRGLDVAGVDIDPEMLATARRKSPDVGWHLADLSTVDLGRSFDVIVMAGNVMIFLAPGSEGTGVVNMARHLAPSGVLIAGFQIMPRQLSIEQYDEFAGAAGLVVAERWATWDRQPWTDGGDYAVSVHRKPADVG
jgi:SAM-dependent methyltransferase